MVITTQQPKISAAAADMGAEDDRQRIKRTLNELKFPQAAQDIIFNPELCPTGLESIASSSELSIQIRQSMSEIITSLDENPSLFGCLSNAWTRMTWWERIGAWLAVSGSPLAVGFVANIGFLIGLSVSTSIGTAMLVDDSTHKQDFTEKLKKGIFGITDALALTISALDAVRQKLHTEVESFQKENQMLSSTVEGLGEQVSNLKKQVESFEMIENHLRQYEIDLQETAKKYAEGEEKNQALFEKTQKDMRETRAEHQKCIALLAEHNMKLIQAKTDLEGKLQQANSIVKTLNSTVTALSTTLIGDRAQKAAFQERVSQFLSGDGPNLMGFASSMSNTEAEFASVRKQLQESLERQQQLVTDHTELLASLKELAPLMKEAAGKRDASLLDKVGFMASPPPSRAGTPPPEYAAIPSTT
jgi:vacuolar-type H+-ATPase subunit I/STV1